MWTASKVSRRQDLIGCAIAGLLLSAAGQAHADCAVTHRLHDVQGGPATQRFGGVHNDVSPINAARVTVEGVVVAAYQGSAQLRGFFLQEESSDEDGDPATSEGVFVNTGSLPPLQVVEGQRVCVTGTVSEYFGMTQLSALTSGSVQLVSGADHRAEIAPAVVTLPVAGDVNDYYEQYEGMLVTFPGDLTIADTSTLDRLGEVVLTSGPLPAPYSQVDTSPTAAEHAAFQAELARRRVLLDDDDNSRFSALPSGALSHPQPMGFGTGVQGLDYFRHGDAIVDLQGVLHWSWAGDLNTDAWRVRPPQSSSPTVAVVNERPVSPPPPAGGLRVASFNVGNFFATIDTTGGSTAPRGADSAAELDRQSEKLAAALAALEADVVGVVEVENDGGYALQVLANRLNSALGSGSYDSVPAGVLGAGATAVGLIYDTTTVRPLGAAAVLTDPAFTSPNGGAQRNVPALAQTFEVIAGTGSGARLTVVINDLAGRDGTGANGIDGDQGDGQGPFNDTRRRAAAYLSDVWLPADPTGQAESNVLLLGTLHAHRGEDPIAALRTGGYTDLIDVHSGAESYTVVAGATRGYVDHALASSSLAQHVVAAGPWHINADEAAAFDYNDTQRDSFGELATEAKPSGRPLYEPNAFRASDHEPVIVDLELAPPVTPGDADGDGDIDRDDLKLINRTKREPAEGPGDARDVDGDGYISVDDVKLARSLCTRPHCSPN